MTDLNLDDLAAWTAAAPDSGVLLPSEIALALIERVRKVEALERENASLREADAMPNDVPESPHGAFAYFLSKCVGGYGAELMRSGTHTETDVRNAVVHALMACAAGEACRIARDDGREPNPEKWRSATDAVFAAAIARTALAQEKKP